MDRPGKDIDLFMPRQAEASRAILPYAITIFVSAFLLFQVQLLLAKAILPWFGGAASVWTTCMLFFQTLLLIGYSYSHWLAQRPRLAMQGRIQLFALTISALALILTGLAWGAPLLPDGSWKPGPEHAPVWHILMLLGIAVGLPYLVPYGGQTVFCPRGFKIKTRGHKQRAHPTGLSGRKLIRIQ